MAPVTLNDTAEQRGFFQRFGFLLGILGVLVVGAVIFVGQSFARSGPPARKMPEVVMVRIVSTPPPPPPPPPPQQKLAEDKMVEQAPVDDSEAKPEENSAPPAADLGTSIKGGAPDGFGLTGNRNGGVLGDSGARSGGSRWGWYASEVQATVSDELRRNPRTRDAAFRIEVRVWPDLTGRLTRVALANSTGDAAVDTAIKTEVLAGLQLKGPPPPGMPLPIVLRLTARRPN